MRTVFLKLDITCREDDNSILAFSAASFTLCKAMGSFVMSIPCYKKINTVEIQ